MKKILILLIAVFTFCVTFVLISSAAPAFSMGHCGKNVMFFFDYSDGSLSFSGSGSMNNYSANSKAPWYSHKDEIKSVTIGEGVTSIGDLAFWGCENITIIEIPSTVTSIGDQAFTGCKNLTEIKVSEDNPDFWADQNGILYYDKYVANVASLVCCPPAVRLTEFSIPSKVRYIDCDAFRGCNGLTNIEIPSSVSEIRKNAFMECNGLTRINIPSSVTTIGERAFCDCTGLKNVKIENGVERIDKYAFQDCSSLTSVTLPSSLKSIREGTFSGCSNLRRVEIPSSVTEIHSEAFFECFALKSIYIPSSVRSLVSYAVGGYLADVDGWLTGDYIKNFTIFGHKGSAAEKYVEEEDKYVKEKRLRFVEVSNSMQSFVKNVEYPENNFVDIVKSEWYYPNVVSAYEHSIMNGKSVSSFAPDGNITIAEAITVAARINHIYRFGVSESLTASEGEIWYTPYIEYAKNNGILTEDYENYDVPATRAQFAKILSYSLDSNCFGEINSIPDGKIPDVNMKSDYVDSVYLLYRAGILTGSDEAGSFNPEATIKRAEAAAILTRIIDENLRKSFAL